MHFMTSIDSLRVASGQYSDKGRKPVNQDFHGLFLAQGEQLRSKGIVVALADGISGSDVSHIASATAVRSFLDDYYSTSDAWSVKQSAQRVLCATNAWLYAQTRQSQHRYAIDRGFVCTFSALILKGSMGYLFHAGDSRIYRLRDGNLELMTRDHRVWLSGEQSLLSRALGIAEHLELDYQAIELAHGDLFLLATDGVHEFVPHAALAALLTDAADTLDDTARRVALHAYDQGSDDNLTVQLVRVDRLSPPLASETLLRMDGLPLPPTLAARMSFDGWHILRELHVSSRSHVYLAVDEEGGGPVALKVPSREQSENPAWLERFMMEEWIARRIDHPHVLKARRTQRPRHYLYTVTEYVEGRTLDQWLHDNPKPELETVRGIVEQIAQGLRAFHRLEMLHQDLRPENVLIDANGTATLIDFGSTRVAGIQELLPVDTAEPVLGTAAFTAPEYFLGHLPRANADLFSLGVIAYRLLGGGLPYGTAVAKTRNRAAQRRLHYIPLRDCRRDVPGWVDHALSRAVHPDPRQRYSELSEFLFDLRHPNPEYLARTRPPLLERNPVAFWRMVALVLAAAVVALLLR